MQAKRFRWLGLVPLLGLIVTSAGARGQGARPWVDPPRQMPAAAPAPASAPEAVSSAAPPAAPDPVNPAVPFTAPDPVNLPAPASTPDPVTPRAGAVDAVPLPTAASAQTPDGAEAKPVLQTEPPGQPSEASLSTAPLDEEDAREGPGAARTSKRKATGEGPSTESSPNAVQAQEPRKAKRHGTRAVARYRYRPSPLSRLFGSPRRGAGIINNSSATR